LSTLIYLSLIVEGGKDMAKLSNIIQRRELEPLLLKAGKIAKHYERAVDCAVSVMSFKNNNQFDCFCKHCKRRNTEGIEKKCMTFHTEAVNQARLLGGSNIYKCPEELVFWTSPFFSGERLAGALISGGIKRTAKNSLRLSALANIIHICANQISGMSFVHKNITVQLENIKYTPGLTETGLLASNQKMENTACSFDMERSLLANLRRGDNKEAEKILHKLLNNHYREVKSNLPAFRLKALELAVLLFRAVSDPYYINDNTTFENYNRYLNKIEAGSNLQEITEALSCFIEKMSEKIFSFHGVRHFPALRKAERFIWNNYTRKLSLQEIAEVSGLSAPYFSTIFKKEMGENLSNYLNRLRTEKAAAMLVTTNIPISEIAKICGFEDQSWFSKIFKNNTGLTPGKYRDQGSIAGLSA